MKHMSMAWLLAAIRLLTHVIPYTSGAEAIRTTKLLERIKAELRSRLDIGLNEAWLNALADAGEEDTVVFVEAGETDVEFSLDTLDTI